MKTWVDIQSKAIMHNVNIVREHIGADVRLMAVVKANAYGHDLLRCAKIVVESGAEYLGVDSIEEGIMLRRNDIECPIVILNPIVVERADECAEYRLDVLVGSFEWLRKVVVAETVNVHLKIDTGMSRQGVAIDQAVDVARFIVEHPWLNLAGVATHFCCADDVVSAKTAEQQERFDEVIAAMQKEGIETGIVHAANSAATLSGGEAHYDMVRVGLALYGMNPFVGDRSTSLKPVLLWKTVVADIKKLPKGSCIGYGATECIDEPRTIAVLPVGYADGYDRRLSSVGEVLVRGDRARVIGRISMNLTTIDITGIAGVSVGDEVTLLGDAITAEMMANAIGTINYEITTRIGAHVQRNIV